MTEDDLRKIIKEVITEELDKRMIIQNPISIYNPYPMYCPMQHPNYKVTYTDHTELRRMTEEIIFLDTIRNIELYSDGTTNISREKYLALEQENENLKKEVKQIGSDFIKKGDYARELEKENKELRCEVEQLRQQLK